MNKTAYGVIRSYLHKYKVPYDDRYFHKKDIGDPREQVPEKEH